MDAPRGEGRLRGLELLAPALAAAGLLALAAAFLTSLRSFRSAVVSWAERDLAVRTELAADTLREPLETSDFRRIHAVGDACEADGVRLVVVSPGGGVFFDSRRDGSDAPRSISHEAPCGPFLVRISLPEDRVLAPFNRARSLFALAALAGAAGMSLLFLLLYRQRVRIAELKRLERFRRDFIADFSHELKTPLTGLIGAAELLEGSVGDEGAVKSLAGIVRNESARLNSLAQDILSLARLGRGREVARFEEADVAEIASEAARALAPAAKLKGVELAFSAEGGAATARCDAQLVSQAVSNLVGNALVHAEAKNVRIAVSASARWIEVSVEDDGRGVPQESRSRIFERFYRADPSHTGEGSGLGLSIVRGIARLHGGDAEYSPVRPSGSRFAFSISRI